MSFNSGFRLALSSSQNETIFRNEIPGMILLLSVVWYSVCLVFGHHGRVLLKHASTCRLTYSILPGSPPSCASPAAPLPPGDCRTGPTNCDGQRLTPPRRFVNRVSKDSSEKVWLCLEPVLRRAS